MRSSPDSVRVPWPGLLAMALVAAALALIGLGDLPLRDFDEGTVAQVALELSQGQGKAALLPTLWGEPYLNKAPGLHSLIGAVIQLSTPGDQLPSEAVVRLVPALLSSLVVPLGGLLQWRLRPGDRGSALATGALLLTLLPIARHGRLAMLDGSQLSAMALLWLAFASLNGRRSDCWWGLTAGLMGSAMLLLKAPLLIPMAAAALAAATLGREWRQCQVGAAVIACSRPPPGHRLASLACPQPRGPSPCGCGRATEPAGCCSTPVKAVTCDGASRRSNCWKGAWPWLLLFPPALLVAWQRRSRWGRWCRPPWWFCRSDPAAENSCLVTSPLAALRPGRAPLLAWLVERTDQEVPLRRSVLRIPPMWMLRACCCCWQQL